jgi:cytochrome c556
MKFFVVLLALISASFFVTTKDMAAHENATGVVKERMVAMETIGNSMKQLAALVLGKIPYDANSVIQNALVIKNHGGSNLIKLFPNGSIDKPSEAHPDIWKNWEEFSALAVRLSGTAGEIAIDASRDSTHAKALFKKLAKTCKICHSSYRQKKGRQVSTILEPPLRQRRTGPLNALAGIFE